MPNIDEKTVEAMEDAAKKLSQATEQAEAAIALLKQQEEALSAAHSCGALSDALYAQAKLELKK